MFFSAPTSRELASLESTRGLNARWCFARSNDCCSLQSRNFDEVAKRFQFLLRWQKLDVGRRKRPSTTLGLIFHAVEYSSRHAGQIVTLARAVSA